MIDFLHLSCEYLREFSKKFEIAFMGYSGALEKLIHEKKDLVALSLLNQQRSID
jgi:hypothetical protein